MSQDVILNNIDHKNLKVISQPSAQYGDNQMCCSLLISEIRDAQRDYPIVFYKHPEDGMIYPMALFGFEKNENLFLTESGWQDGYMIPARIAKGPFKIGRQQTSHGVDNLIITVDLADARINESQGEPLFLEFGGESDYIQNIGTLLNRLNHETPHTADFTASLDKLALLEPLTMEIDFGANEGVSLTGFYMLNEEKMTHLDGSTLADLSSKGYLQTAYMCVASLSNFSKLVQRKQQKSPSSSEAVSIDKRH